MSKIDKLDILDSILRSKIIPKYANDAAYESAKGSAGAEDELYWNTTINWIRVHNGTSWGDLQSPAIVDGSTDSVSGGGDALKTQLAAYESKILLDKVTINVAAGTYNIPDVKNFFSADEGFMDIVGDTRSLAGLMFVEGATPLYYDSYGITEAGKGTSNSDQIYVEDGNDGADYVQVRWGNQSVAPDFSDFGSGDKLIVKDNTNTFTELTVSSVSGNKIYTTAAPPTLGNDGDSLVMVPDRIISGSGGSTMKILGNQGRVRFRGFAFQGFDDIEVGPVDFSTISDETKHLDAGVVKFLNCLFKHTGLKQGTGVCYLHASSFTGISGSEDVAINIGIIGKVQGRAILRCAAFGMAGDDFALDCFFGGSVYITQSCFTGQGGLNAHKDSYLNLVASEIFERELSGSMAAVDARYGGMAYVNYVTVQEDSSTRYCIAFYAALGGRICDEDQITALACNYGLYANNGGFISAHPSGFGGNVTNYSPASSGALGNNGSMVVRV